MGGTERLTRRGDFSKLFRGGEKYDSGPVRLWAVRKNEGPLRTAFVGRSKRSVRRNRIKRRLREAFRVCFSGDVYNNPYDLLFMSDERLLKSDFHDIAGWIGRLLQRAGVLDKGRICGECEKKHPDMR